MGNINNKLTYLNETKSLIKQSIINKGINISETDSFRSYSEKINSISSTGKIKIENKTKFGWSELTTYPANKYDFSEMTDGRYLFRESLIQQAPELKNINGSSSRMFQDCKNLLMADYEIGKPDNLGNMFYGCEKLKRINHLDFTNANDCYQMFYGCNNLTVLNIYNLGASKNIPSNRALELHQCINWGNDSLAASQGINGASDSLYNSLYTNSYNRKNAGLPVVTIKLANSVLQRLTWTQRDNIQKKGYTLIAA